MVAGLFNFILRNTNSGYGSGNQILISSGMFSDRTNRVYDGESLNCVLQTPSNYFTAWVIKESTTQTIVASGAGLNVSFTGNFTQELVTGGLPQGVKTYTLEVVTTKGGNVFKRRFEDIYTVLPEDFTEGEADVVWNLSSSTSYKDGAGTDRPGYKIWVKGVHTGAGYLGMEQWRSTDPTQPIHIKFADGTEINTTAAYCMRLNFDCQNVVLDASGNAEYRYAAEFQMTDSGGQAVIIEPVDVAAGSTLSTAGTNVTMIGFYVDGNRFCSSGLNVNFDNATGATINYDTWSYTGLKLLNNYFTSTNDEGYYLGRFNDQLVSGYAKPKIQGALVAYNTINDSGADGLQAGILFDCNIHHNQVTNCCWRNATDHRNMLQLIACDNVNVFSNYFSYNPSEGGCFTWNIANGRGGKRVNMWGNVFDNRTEVSHVNGYIVIEQSVLHTELEYNIYNNTVLAYSENSIEVGRANTGVTTVIDPLRIVDNVLLNLNDPDQITYFNTPNQSGFTISNLFNSSSAYYGFTSYPTNLRPLDLSSAMFGYTTSFTKTHPAANCDFDGYEFVDGIRGAFSGVTLQI